jgi:hypothetical protein
MAAADSRKMARRPLELLARTGFLINGCLYMVIGILSLQAAAGFGGRVTGVRGALLTVLAQPFGRVLLLLSVIGFFGYAIWRILQGLLDPNHLGQDLRAKAIRLSYVGRGLMHAGLGVQAVRLYAGLPPSSSAGEREVAAEAFRWPFGDWLVVLIGIGLIGFAFQQLYAAIKSQHEQFLDIDGLRRDAGEWAVSLSRFGMAARAIVFAVLGWFIANAGWFRDASKVATTATSMRTLARQPGGAGPWLLGITAAGFIAYGFYQFINARYMHIRPVVPLESPND